MAIRYFVFLFFNTYIQRLIIIILKKIKRNLDNLSVMELIYLQIILFTEKYK